MPTALRILILEDEPNDAELEIAVLEEAGYGCRWERVETREDFLACLDRPDYDLILSDYKLPAFDGLTALGLVLERGVDIPVIMLSGMLGEEAAIESLKAGATDYVLKNRLSRLAPVVRRALKEHADSRQHRRAEETLRFTQFSVDNLTDAVYWMGPDAKFVYVNNAAVEALGYSQAELLTMTVHDIGPEFPVEVWPTHWAELKRRRSFVIHTIHQRKDESTFPVEITVNFIQFGGKGINCAIARDITERTRAEAEREKLQAQLNQAQKMESVGRLAGGVAHDFNNMLSVILGQTELALERLTAGGQTPAGPLFDGLQEIRAAARRSAELTRQLLAFARKQTIAPQVLDLNETVGGMLKMLQRLIGEDIHLAWLPGPGVWQVLVDPSQIDQVMANLCVNARDAITDVGKLTIETGNATFDEHYCEEHPGFAPGEYVLLAVSDDGCGMGPEVREKLFEPFFTTKETGTGLGLSTVYGIVKQNDGFISVYSEPGDGTTFKVYLPRHAGKAGHLQEESRADPADRGQETILLVEDEPAILKLATMMLERQGYTVLAASTPGEAIRLAGEHAGSIHLLMTDVVMPEMNGRDLAKNLLSLYPNLKRLFMSGYTANVIAHRGVIDEGVNFIQKPFTIRELSAKVRQALDGD